MSNSEEEEEKLLTLCQDISHQAILPLSFMLLKKTCSDGHHSSLPASSQWLVPEEAAWEAQVTSYAYQKYVGIWFIRCPHQMFSEAKVVDLTLLQAKICFQWKITGNYQSDRIRLYRTSIGLDPNPTASAYIGPLMVWIYQ
ncbi:hypothetical protein AAES_24342 [Amazona aestiva]|uniref:Uncharacterized protein n=1 Tax=Amazona aestiva TaxID=12930 RepID=A0A0Q3WZD4_AMAAE|nr:hypothetical protein AAES_24342 [Amazona aestiva]